MNIEKNIDTVQQENESVLNKNKQGAKKIISAVKFILSSIATIVGLVLLILTCSGFFDEFFHKLGLYGDPNNETVLGSTGYQTATGETLIKGDDGKWYYEDNSKNKDTTNAVEKIDLYISRFDTENEIVNNFDFEYNELGWYPTEDDATILCSEGSVFMINIDENNADKYCFCGVSVGDDATEAKEKLSKCFTFLYSRQPNILRENTMDDRYSDNEFGGLIITYYIDTNKIKKISYIAMEEEIETTNETLVEEEIETESSIILYESVLDEISTKYGQSSDYSIVDIDKDGIDELIISYGTCDADWQNDVYTLVGDRILYLGKFYNAANLYLADNHIADGVGIIAVSGLMGIENIEQIKKSGNILFVDNIIYRELPATEDYYSNDKYILKVPTTDKSLLYEDTEVYSTTINENEMFVRDYEFVTWNDSQETKLYVFFDSDLSGGIININKITYNGGGASSKYEYFNYYFLADSENEGVYGIYDEYTGYQDMYFSISFNECYKLTIYNTNTGLTETFIEKGYAYNNVS